MNRSLAMPRILLLALLFTGMSLSVAVFQALLDAHRRSVTAEFERAAEDRVRVVEQMLRSTVATVVSASAFARAAASPDLHGFSDYALAALEGTPGALALSWNPRVPHAQRRAFEEAPRPRARGPALWERGPDGQVRAASPRDDYYVVRHIEPIEPNQVAIGFDIGSEPVRRAALEQARDSARVAATGGIDLVQSPGAGRSVLVFGPVYAGPAVPGTLERRRERFAGVVVAVVGLRALVEAALDVLQPGGVDLAVYDESGASHTLLHVHWSRTRPDGIRPPPATRIASAPLSTQASIDWAGRRWRIVGGAAQGRYLLSAPPVLWTVPVVGMLLTLAVLFLVHYLYGRSQRLLAEQQVLEARVAERTAELEKAHRSLVRQERLAAIGQLTGTVAHELRNPLGTISTTFETIRRRTLDMDESMERAVARIDRSIARCTNIIGDLLDFARVREPAPVRTVADQWVRAVLDEYEVPDEVQLRRDLAAGEAEIAIDHEMFTGVIVNLLDNAFEAVMSLPDVAPAATRGARGSVRLATRVGGEHVSISVEDDGVGVATAAQEEIFEPLVSTKSSGTGLGLPLVARVVEQHDGTVEFRSTEGGGTRVVVSVPCVGHGSAREGAGSSG